MYTQVLYLMDQFSVSDKFYHELTMILPTLPRSYMIKDVQTTLNRSLKTQILRVPGPHHGVYCSITEKLCEEIEKLVSATTKDNNGASIIIIIIRRISAQFALTFNLCMGHFWICQRK